jgi:hypothetical protein
VSEKLTLLQRINAVQQEVDYIQKEKKQGMRYSIVSHDAVTAKTRPLLVKHGVVYYPISITSEQVGNRTQMHMVVRFVSVDDAADFMDVHSVGYGIDDQDKGPGKAESYAVKYALLKALGLETGDDPELDQDEVHKVDEPKARRQTGINPNTGMATSYALKNDKGPDNWDAFQRELLECQTVPALGKLAMGWSTIAERDKWPASWRELAKEEINKRRDIVLNGAPDDDVFPGDRPSVKGNSYVDNFIP